MRQIKFRALCNVDCKEGDNITKMVYFSQLELDNGLWFNPDDENIHHINEWLTKPMQFTGLKDKNGVDIYEGDIINYSNTIKGVVKYNNSKALFYVEVIEKKYKKLPLTFNGINLQETEIIGNIYEHKHLLK